MTHTPEHPLTAARQEIILAHEVDIIRIIGEAVLQGTMDGRQADISWQRSDSLSTQQHVSMVDLDISGTEVPVVFRETYQGFPELYDQSSGVRKHYPALYMHVDIPTRKPGARRRVLLMELLKGYHADHGNRQNQDFYDFIEQPPNFESVCQDTFAATTAIMAEDLDIADLRPPLGKNAMYVPSRRKTIIFDPETVCKSMPSALRPSIKYIRFLEDQYRKTDLTTAYITRMLQLYIETFPDSDLFNAPTTHTPHSSRQVLSEDAYDAAYANDREAMTNYLDRSQGLLTVDY